MRAQRNALLVAALAVALPLAAASGQEQPKPASAPAAGLSKPLAIVGVDQSGNVCNSPSDWPAAAGPWNGKGARYNPRTRRLLFETFREDIVGGAVAGKPGEIKAPGVNCFFVAGPGTGAFKPDGTTVLYVSGRNGENPRGIGCRDIVDGQGKMAVYRALLSTSETPNAPQRQARAIVYANQNKDLAAWHPDGQWIFAAVEMNRHALTHDAGNGETGRFNNLWAISVDGNIWVQLTDFEATWRYYDPVAPMPYAAYDVLNAPESARYASLWHRHPYVAYSASAKGEPPPASGVFRPTAGNSRRGGKVPIVWGERVGLHPKYAWGGTLQLATAEIVFVNGLPALVNYRRNLTPSPQHPDGRNLWSNPGGDAVIGAGYEP